MAQILGSIPLFPQFRERGLKYDVDTIPVNQCGVYPADDLDKTLKSVKGSIVSFKRKHSDAKFVARAVTTPGVLPEGVAIPCVAVWRLN
jgi:hypothetical protein